MNEVKALARLRGCAYESKPLLIIYTVIPVQNSNSKMDRTKILMTNGSLMKVEIPLEHSAILLTCIK